MRLAGIHHVALRVFDLDEAAERWSRQFGFTVRERHDDRVLLACAFEDYSLELLASGERHQMLAEWNDTGEDGWAAPVTALVERWCREQPDAPAVADAAGRTLTWGALGERSGPGQEPASRTANKVE